MKRFEGVFTALVTPFDKGQLDLESLKRLVAFQVQNGVQGFVVAGTTGESPTISKEEKRRIFDLVRSETGEGFPVLVGTGTPSTDETLRQSEEVCGWGADGLLIVTPYYNRPPQRGLVAHYQFIADRVSLPILLYNVPGRTGVSLSDDSIVALSQHKNIVGIKEASGDISFGQKIVGRVRQDFVVTSGDDVTFVDLGLVGGRGVISVLSHIIPAKTREFTDRFRKNDASVQRDFVAFKDLARALFVEANPIPVKCALKAMGIIKSDELRLPLSEMEETGRRQLFEILKRYQLIS